MEFTTIALAILLLLLLYILYSAEGFTSGDPVLKDFDDWQGVEKLLTETTNDVKHFLSYLRKKYDIDDNEIMLPNCCTPGGNCSCTQDELYRKYVVNLVKNFNPNEMFEKDPRNEGTSITIGKRKMYLCMRSKSPPYHLIDKNVLIFVWLHEASHVALYDVYQHPIQFWQFFKWLLQEAVGAGIYHPVDYGAHPVTYCGLHLNYNPLFS